MAGARFDARPGGADPNPARRYSFWRGGGVNSANIARGDTHLTEIPINSDSLRAAHKNGEAIFMFDSTGDDAVPHSLDDDQLFMLA